MYDRRTGESVGRRSFRPRNQGCGDTLTSEIIYKYPVDSELDAWANTFFK